MSLDLSRFKFFILSVLIGLGGGVAIGDNGRSKIISSLGVLILLFSFLIFWVILIQKDKQENEST